MPSALRWLGLLSTAVAAVFGSREAPPTLDDLWGGQAAFHQVRSFVLNAPGFEAVDAATRVVVVNGSWVLFGRADSGPTKLCPSGVITTNVRVSTDQGATWSQVSTTTSYLHSVLHIVGYDMGSVGSIVSFPLFLSDRDDWRGLGWQLRLKVVCIFPRSRTRWLPRISTRCASTRTARDSMITRQRRGTTSRSSLTQTTLVSPLSLGFFSRCLLIPQYHQH